MIIERLRARWRVGVFITHPLEFSAAMTIAVLCVLSVATTVPVGYVYPIALVVIALATVGAALRHAWVGCLLWAGLLAWLVIDGPLLPTVPNLLSALAR